MWGQLWEAPLSRTGPASKRRASFPSRCNQVQHADKRWCMRGRAGVGRWPSGWLGHRAPRAEARRRRCPCAPTQAPPSRRGPEEGAACAAGRAGQFTRWGTRQPGPLSPQCRAVEEGSGPRPTPSPSHLPQITGWKLEGRQVCCRSQWRHAASASRSAGSPPRRRRAHPGPPASSALGGGGASAGPRPDSPARVPRKAALRSCALLLRREARPYKGEIGRQMGMQERRGGRERGGEGEREVRGER